MSDNMYDECPRCKSRNIRVKDHGSWFGYHCQDCGSGGSCSHNRRRATRYQRSRAC